MNTLQDRINTLQDRIDWLNTHGYNVGHRDVLENPGVDGKYMVKEIDGSYCIVGNDIEELVSEAYAFNRAFE